MKTLLILRHAKAQPDAPEGDHRRNLTDRGRRDASSIGTMIKSIAGVPDAIVTSDANRALQTAELAADACGFAGELTIDPAIYGADSAALIQIVRGFSDSADCVVIVGHNPGMEDLVAILYGAGSDLEHLPTAGLAHVLLESDRWKDLEPKLCRVLQVMSPRKPDVARKSQ